MAPLLVVCASPWSAAAAEGTDGESLRVVEVVATPSVARVVVALPESQAGRNVGAEAFTVTSGGNELPSQVTPRPTDQLDVALVIDTSSAVSEPDLASAKAATADFLRSLPEGSRASLTTTAPASVIAPLAPVRDESLRALDGLARSDGGDGAAALRLASDTMADRARRRTVLVALPTASSPVAATTVDGVVPPGIALVVIGAPPDGWSAVVARSGGVGVPAGPDALRAAYASTRSFLLLQYELLVDLPPSTQKLLVRLATEDVQTSTEVSLTDPPAAGVAIGEPAVEARASDGGGRDRSGLLALAAGAAALIALGAFLVARARRDGERGPERVAAADVSRRERGRAGDDVTAVALHQPRDADALRAAFAARGIDGLLVVDPADAFAAVVRGTPLLVVDAGIANALPLLRSVRRRIDDGWSECAVIAYYGPGTTVDVEVGALIDAVATYPLTPGDLDIALSVAFTQRADRHVALERAAGPGSTVKG